MTKRDIFVDNYRTRTKMFAYETGTASDAYPHKWFHVVKNHMLSVNHKTRTVLVVSLTDFISTLPARY